MVEYESRFARPVYNKFGEKIYLDQMTMAELLERVKKNDIVFVPCASTESHGLAQAMGEDTLIGTYIAERVAFETGATVAPPIFYGSHPSHHYGMPGTIPIKK
ncbi:MAG: creatininase family protein, partial [Thermofilaceae archaeon]